MDYAWILVRILHILFIAWMVYAPFSGNEVMLVFHAMIAPFLMLHWILHADGCILTVLEKHLRGIDNDSQSFIHSIVGPIYMIDDASLKKIVFMTTFALWMITLSQLNRDMITRVFTGHGN